MTYQVVAASLGDEFLSRSLTRCIAPSRLGCRRLKALAGDPFPLSPSFPSLLPLRRCSASLSPLCTFQVRRRAVLVSLVLWSLRGARRGWAIRREGPYWVRRRAMLVSLVLWSLCGARRRWSIRREGPYWVRFFLKGRDCLCPSRSGWIGSFSCFLVSLDRFSMLPSPVWWCVWLVGGPGMEHPADPGARLASRGRGRCVPLLAASGGGLVVVVVMTFPHDVSNPWWHRHVWFPDLVVCPGFGVVLLVGPRPCGARGSSSRELGVGRAMETAVTPRVVINSESECCELLYLSDLR
ncbi:hypothetical protein Taro_002113, partial [Colocasia esculenta]|nr:hypothetical protein [Colocasia esculenta]